MKNLTMKSSFIIVLVSSSILLTGCMEEIKETFQSAQEQVTEVMNPMPKCSDKEVILEVNKKLSEDALYGTHATVKVGTILVTATNEQTGAKTCKAVVSYTIDEKDNKISSFLSKVPGMKSVSKDRTIAYIVSRDQDKKSFLVTIK